MPPVDDDELGRMFSDALRRSDTAPSECDPDLIWRAGRRRRRTRLALAGSGTATCFATVAVALGLTLPGDATPMSPPTAVTSSALPGPKTRAAISSGVPLLGDTDGVCGAASPADNNSRLPILPDCIAVPYLPPGSPCAAIPSDATSPAIIIRRDNCTPRAPGVLGPSALPS